MGTDDSVDKEKLRQRIDENLAELNDDYRVERQHALQNVYLDILLSDSFYEWMKSEGKEGGQSKFPRVLKKEKLESWLKFVQKLEHASI